MKKRLVNLDHFNDGDSHKTWDVYPMQGDDEESFFAHVLNLGRNPGDTDKQAASRILTWESAKTMPVDLKRKVEAVAKGGVSKAGPEGMDLYVPGANGKCKNCGKRHRPGTRCPEGMSKAITPGGRVGDASPLGDKPGGKRQLVDYVREIAHALMRKGMDKSKAIQMARGILQNWASGRGNVSAKVRAAAAKALAAQQALDSGRRVVKADTRLSFDEHMAIRKQMRDDGYLAE